MKDIGSLKYLREKSEYVFVNNDKIYSFLNQIADFNYSYWLNDLNFFKNALWITRKSKKDYLNDLIRQDFIKTIGARKNATDDELKELWKNYKKENNL